MLKPANSAPYNIATATINELTTATTNAVNRLKGIDATATAPAITTQQIVEEIDPVTWASIQVMLAAAAATDPAKLAAALAALQ